MLNVALLSYVSSTNNLDAMPRLHHVPRVYRITDRAKNERICFPIIDVRPLQMQGSIVRHENLP